MVNDGIFGNLTDKKSMYESVMVASMKKVIPLDEEYVSPGRQVVGNRYREYPESSGA